MTSTVNSAVRRITLVVGIAALAAVTLASPASAIGSSVVVKASDFSTNPATTGGWLIDDFGGSNHAVIDIASPAAGQDASLRMHLVNASDKAVLHYRYAPASFPTSSSADNFASFRALLANASYSFKGANANFQIGVFFKPTDDTYGPTGVAPNKCGAATSYLPGWCFATLKYEPYVTPSAFTTVPLASTFDNGYVFDDHAGWWRSQRVGSFAKPGAPDDVSLNDMLGQMSDIVVYGFGVSIGAAATPDVTSWVHDFSFGGTNYSFGANAPAAAPYPDTVALTAAAPDPITFTPTANPAGGPSNLDLTSVNPSTPLYGTAEWSPNDNFVDVYSYSTAAYVGTFPVVGGLAHVAAPLTALAPGTHHLLLVGQSTNTPFVINFTVVAPAATAAALAATGTDAWPLAAFAAALLAAGGLLVLRRRRTARS